MRPRDQKEKSRKTRINPQASLFLACATNDLEKAKKALRDGADPNATFNGRTPLHFSVASSWAMSRARPVVRLLLDSGADPELRDSHGKTPLVVAIEHRSPGTGTLIESGADVCAVDSNGGTPLHAAAEARTPSVASVLLGRGADPFAKDSAGRTPLDIVRDRDTETARIVKSAILAKMGRDGLPDESHARPPRGTLSSDQKLRSAIEREDAVALANALADGADPELVLEEGARPLHWAAKKGFVSSVKLLLKAGADPNVVDDNGWVPLNWAIGSGDKTVSALLKGGADPDGRGADTPPLVTYAFAKKKNRAVLAALLKAGARPDAPEKKHGMTALHVAAAVADIGTVTALVAAGATVDAKNSSGRTPLMCSIGSFKQNPESGRRSERKRVLAFLVRSGADVDARSLSGATVLHSAAASDDHESVEDFLEAGADPDAKDHRGKTPLHYAALYGGLESVLKLLAGGADPTAGDSNGDLPFHDAKNAKVKGVLRAAAEEKMGGGSLPRESLVGDDLKRLIDGGVDPNDSDGDIPLIVVAASYVDDYSVERLVRMGADPDARAPGGQTALFYASSALTDPAKLERQKRIRRFLLGHGADPNARDASGATPLFRAAGFGDSDAVEDLLAAGADPIARKKNGETPLDVARSASIRKTLEDAALAKMTATDLPKEASS